MLKASTPLQVKNFLTGTSALTPIPLFYVVHLLGHCYKLIIELLNTIYES